ncbi:hypothetical protein WA158_003937 [Blastocystis sp. Blastoise]
MIGMYFQSTSSAICYRSPLKRGDKDKEAFRKRLEQKSIQFSSQKRKNFLDNKRNKILSTVIPDVHQVARNILSDLLKEDQQLTNSYEDGSDPCMNYLEEDKLEMLLLIEKELQNQLNTQEESIAEEYLDEQYEEINDYYNSISSPQGNSMNEIHFSCPCCNGTQYTQVNNKTLCLDCYTSFHYPISVLNTRLNNILMHHKSVSPACCCALNVSVSSDNSIVNCPQCHFSEVL